MFWRWKPLRGFCGDSEGSAQELVVMVLHA